MTAITDTGYAEQVLRTAKELAETIRSKTTERSEAYALAIIALAEAAVMDGRK